MQSHNRALHSIGR